MKRNVFQTKNQLFLHRYIFMIATMVILSALFLIIANLSLAAESLHLDSATTEEISFDKFAAASSKERESLNELIQSANVTGPNALKISIYNPKNDNTMIITQLLTTKQPYEMVNAISQVDQDTKLLIIDTESLTEEETDAICSYVEDGMSILFTGLPDAASLQNSNLLQLLGIASVSGETTWKGIRTSSDLLTGTMVENSEYEVSGIEVKLSDNNKIYACALPDKYWLYENDDLPPIIWRHIDSGSGGRVYVFNGDFQESEMGYGIIPVVLSEINENYIYPVINAYCVTASGYPYAENEERESWERLYSRDKLLIQQDMLSSQIKRYSNLYKARITCFSPDYETFLSTEDTSLTYYTNQISSSRGLLAAENNGVFTLGENTQGTNIVSWTTDFRFWDESTGTLNIPICFNSTVEDVQAEEYKIAGFASTMGFFSVNIDYDDFLNYDGEDDVWALYCNDQETMLGTEKRDYGWLERVTVKEAFGRILKLLTMKVGIEYFDDHINVSVDNFEDEAWFILRSSCKDPQIDNGTIEEIGTNCYFVTLKAANAVITWKDNSIESMSDR